MKINRDSIIDDLTDNDKEYILNYFGYDTISKAGMIDGGFKYCLKKYDNLSREFWFYVEIDEIVTLLRDIKINKNKSN